MVRIESALGREVKAGFLEEEEDGTALPREFGMQGLQRQSQQGQGVGRLRMAWRGMRRREVEK